MAQSTTYAEHSLQRRVHTEREGPVEMPVVGEWVIGEQVKRSDAGYDPAWIKWTRSDQE